MPGYGDADKPRDLPYTVDRLRAPTSPARWTSSACARVHLVLHDFGGPWGLQWAADHPEQHASTTLINTGVILREGWHALAKVWRTPVLGELFFMTSTRGGMRQFMKRTNPPTFPVPSATTSSTSTRTRARAARSCSSTATRRSRPHVEAVAPALREHPRPTLVVWGAKDPYLKVRLAERQREVFRDARVTILPGSGHWPLADAPAAVAAAVLPFLRSRPRQPARGGRHVGCRAMLCQVRTYTVKRGRDGRVRRAVARPHRPRARGPRVHRARRVARRRRNDVHVGRRPRGARRLGARSTRPTTTRPSAPACRATPSTS